MAEYRAHGWIEPTDRAYRLEQREPDFAALVNLQASFRRINEDPATTPGEKLALVRLAGRPYNAAVPGVAA